MVLFYLYNRSVNRNGVVVMASRLSGKDLQSQRGFNEFTKLPCYHKKGHEQYSRSSTSIERSSLYNGFLYTTASSVCPGVRSINSLYFFTSLQLQRQNSSQVPKHPLNIGRLNNDLLNKACELSIFLLFS